VHGSDRCKDGSSGGRLKSSPTAIVALCISIASAVFSFFQWWNSRAESRINAAIEVSKANLRERDLNTMAAVIKVLTSNEPLTAKEMLLLGDHADQLEYIAFLANTGKLDKSYLSVSIVCDVAITNAAIQKLKEKIPPMAKSPEHQMEEFSRTAKCDIKKVVHGFLPPQSN
jgi:predicted ATP-binding protein involved in virulence